MSRSPLSRRHFAAVLFDMDGTMLNSIPAVERVWANWARHHGLDVDAFLPTVHGMRAIETVERLGLPNVDPVDETRTIERAELEDLAGVEAIDGVSAFLGALPAERWAIVTSATRALAQKRLAAAGLPEPGVLISSDDVSVGKPAPDGFLMAAGRLGQPIQHCLIFEDSLAGIHAAEAAGASVVVITATHKCSMHIPHPQLPGFGGMQVTSGPNGMLEISIPTIG